MKPLVVIPARSGSKGVPGKNIKELGGKPLIQYTIDVARKIFPNEVICFSTDDNNIKNLAEGLGLNVPFIRPAELATDEAGTYQVLLHAIHYYESCGYFPDTLVLLQPTSPFRTELHVKEAIGLYDDQCDMVVSVKETRSKPNSFLLKENEVGWLEQLEKGIFESRQACPIVYEYNGAIYIASIDELKQKPFYMFKRIRKYVMDELSSHDIDTMLDWLLAETILNNITLPSG